MKFIKGMVMGGLLSAGMIMMYKDNSNMNRKMMRKGRQFAKKMGMY